jgi:hypothetical protein
MSVTEPPRPARAATSIHLRVIFGLGALGLTIQWFDRFERVRGGGAAGWSQAWDWAGLFLLPFGIGYFAYRAVISDRRAEPGPAPPPGP